MKLRVLVFFLIGLALPTHAIFSTRAHALISSEASLSGGYYKDFTEKNRFPVFFSWNLNHTTGNGIETYFDLGANNNLVENQWGFYLYQGYVTVPFSGGFDNAPSKKTRIHLGRQWLTEGFEMSILDGIQLPVYWSENGGFTLLGGASYAMQTDRIDTHSQIYGGTAHQKFMGFTWKGGFFQKRKSSEDTTTATQTQPLAHAGVLRSFESLPLKPLFHAKAQWDLDAQAYDQGYGELSLFPTETLSFGTTYSHKQPSLLDALEGHFIYRLFAMSAVNSLGGFATWNPLDDLQIQATVRDSTYHSQAGKESGNEQELTVTWLRGRWTLIPSVVHLQSYGGEFWEPALGLRFDISNNAALKLQAAAAHIDKINGMKSWAYHGRGGVETRLAPRLSVMALAEAESNHFFKVDARALAFLSYLLY